jgi:hypothetical protein
VNGVKSSPVSSWELTTLEAIATKDGYGFVDGPFGSNLPASKLKFRTLKTE